MNYRKIYRVLLLLLIIALAFSFSSCETENAPITLSTPKVVVSERGMASWGFVPHAVAYVYKINGGMMTPTSDLEIQLNDGDSITVKAIGDKVAYLDSDWSEAVSYVTNDGNNDVSGDGTGNNGDTTDGNGGIGDGNTGGATEEKTQLSIPTVTVSTSGLASWSPIQGASLYVYKINGVAELETNETSVSLKDGESISVKAVGAGNYLDSEYSESKTFNCVHSDGDKNGVCDNCAVKTTVIIDIYAINDLHGVLMDTDTQPGVDELTTYIFNKYEDSSAYKILLSSGDMWQGTVESSSNKGLFMTEWMNLLGFSAMTVGNHEYDWGAEYIEENAAIAEFPFLAINIRYNGKRG